MLTHFWQFCILSELVFACETAALNSRFRDLGSRLRNTAPAASLPERLLLLLENCWNRIDEFTGVQRNKNRDRTAKANLIASRGLTAKLLSDLMNYPIDDRFLTIKRDFFSLLVEMKRRVIILFDGFDLLRNDELPREGVRLIFESLVAATRAINCDPNLPQELLIKALIPHDRYLHLTLGDSDKVDSFHMAIRWNYSSLKEFLKKRLELCPKLQGTSFNHLWREVMPEGVLNSRYGIEEDSYDYILRHTMYRPRHLQLHP
jgi:hypothetical protein